jgi:hypothetical protein
MERINRKRKFDLIDDLNENNFMEISFQIRDLTIVRKRKFDNILINEESIQINKFIKIYSCSLHDNDKEICNIYNCNGINNINFTENNINYIN